MSLHARLRASLNRVLTILITCAGSTVLAQAAMAARDNRAVSGAQNAVSAVPEPGAILLFAAGAAIVGWSLQKRRRES